VFTTLATLLLELALTRIFSVVFHYHLSFLAISIALFGLGAGGVLSYLAAGEGADYYGRLGRLALGNALAAVAALAFLLSRRGELSSFTLLGIYLACALPFLFAGMVVSMVIGDTIERVNKVYFYDLLGAAGGCLLLVPLLEAIGGPSTVIAAAVLYSTAGAIWYTLAGAPRGRIVAVALGLALVALVVYNKSKHVVDVKYAKGQELKEEFFVKWNSFSRIAITQDSSRMMMIVIDADASTGIASYDIDHLSDEQRAGLLSEGPGLPYALRPAAKTLIIGPGGGFDVTRALASGSKNVTGVEINPIIARTIMKEKFPSLSRNLYLRPEVKIVEEDGRSFVRRSPEKFQVLQATLVDTWASTAAGAFALSENNLYTSDAFYDYLTHLTDDGILAFTRWGFQPPRESLRLLTLAMDALERLGEKRFTQHVIVARENAKNIEGWGATDTVLISRKPFSFEDVEHARQIMQSAKIEPIYLPGDKPDNPFYEVLHTPDLDGFLARYPYDVSPVDDNRPFFFYTVQPRDVWRFISSGNQDSADFKINRAVPTLFSLVSVSILATIAMLALPPLVLGSRLPAERGVRVFLLYFLCIGVGYILVQVALIQKFVLLLGHPTYALIVIIFAMLIASSLGSFWSKRLGAADRDSTLRTVLMAVAALVTVLSLVVTPLANAAVGWPFAARVLLTIALIAPPAFAMGMPFPSGLARLERWHKPSVRWAWSINAAASVLGSALAMFLALYLGLRETLFIGGLLYLGALAALFGSSTSTLFRSSSQS
jgi:hypothetical protein